MRPAFPPEIIPGPRLMLRKHPLAMAEALFKAVDSDRARLREFLPWVDLTCSLRDEEDYIRMTQERWECHELFDFGIYRKESSDREIYLGNIGVHSISWPNDRCELGYWILGEHEGKGYMTEAVRTLGAALFCMGMNRIEIRCSSANERSAWVPRACGYRLEGTFRQDTMDRGRYQDTYVFARLRNDK